GLNGDGGALYNSVKLTGKIGSDGLYLVAHSSAPKAIADQADQKTSTIDYQNGPDSVQLRYGGKIVDAIGYGNFSGKKFGGEGTPTVDVVAGHSLARDKAGSDTDNNVKDFKDTASPTPGSLNIAANKPPVAKIACPGGGAPGALLQFDASASYDPEGQIDQYTFDFGDGTAAVKSATPKVNHTFKKAGTFTVKLSVIDNEGATATASCVVGVSAGNKYPTAKLVCPGSVALNQTFSVDASGSSDDDGVIAKYAFAMGDGSATKTGSVAKVNHAYKKAGTFTVNLTVTDNKNATAKASCTIKATAGTPPSVNIIKPFDGKQVTQGDIIPMIVDATPPAGKKIVKVEFFVDGKSIGTDTTAPYEAKWTVPATAKTGSKAILTATATDSAGTPGSSKPVSLLIANDKPNLSFTAVVSGKLKVVLDANGVSDTESAKAKLQVRVDWENDGKWDTAWATSKVYEHTYAKEGKFTIKVAVRDEAGQETVGTKNITLSSTLTVSGTVKTTTWTGTVVVTGDLVVPSGNVLTVAPGTSVLFAPIDQNKDGVGDFDLVVSGKLVVKGTKDEPVVFTVYGKTKTAGKGWNRVKLQGAGSVIDWAIFEYAQTGLEVRNQATINNAIFQQNQTGIHVGSSGKATLTAATSKDNLNHGLYVTNGGSANSAGSTWSSNGNSGVKTYNTSSANLTLNMTGDKVEVNGLAGIEVAGYASGLVTKSIISNNAYEGLRLYALTTYDPQVAFRINNITENATVGARVAGPVNKSAATTGKEYNTNKLSSVWKTPNGGLVEMILAAYSEYDYSKYNYVRGYVNGNTGALLSFTSSSSKRWRTVSPKASQLVAKVYDKSGSSYYGSTTIYAAAWTKKGEKREASVVTYSKTVDLRHNYWGVFPNVLSVVGLSQPGAANLDGFVGKYFDKTWTRAPYYGGETIASNQSWNGQVWITGDLTVPSGKSVTVAPGTKISIVRHDKDGNGVGDVYWNIYGVLTTNGTSAQPVLIGPADTTNKSRAWENIKVYGSKSAATLTHTIIEYGSHGLELQSGKHTLTNVTLRKNYSNGLHVNGGTTWTAKKVTFTDNGGHGLWANNASGLVDGGKIEGNGNAGAYFSGSGTSTVLKNLNINKNNKAGVIVVKAKPTLTQLNINYNGVGVWVRGSAAGSVTKSNIKYNNHEGILLMSESYKSPATSVSGNNIYGNSVKEGGGVTTTALTAATNGKEYDTAKTSAMWKGPKGEKVHSIHWRFSEYDYSKYNYIRGYVRLSKTGKILISATGSSSARWQDISSHGATSIVAQVYDKSGSSYYGSTTVYNIYYRGSNLTTELTAATSSGKINATKNYWGTFLDVEKKLALARKDAIDFQGFTIGEVNGTGPQ
ncbi:MAG: PKD domain-containing protein, partial [Myxococcales bacterium]|nr:PKD domain-containing protein [Myxococcales bacterium]